MSTPADFASSAQQLVAALYSASVDPADALRLLSSLANLSDTSPPSADTIGQAMAAMDGAIGTLFRRSAVIAMARASAAYQPASADDAAAVRTQVCAALDNEITIAGDQGDDASFNALRALRAAVSTDLGRRGAQLPTILNVASAIALPAPVLAQRLYRDPSRADELVIQGDPIHPAFMPTKFKALSK